ncbi:MAG: sulfite exporter TauE/SafE family protein [Planctomycetia bacterium]|nr:sulfite exporter TauE/SafE family protein [Planctomycetia bacterium]
MDPSLTKLAILAVAGVGAGALGALLGTGGGVFVVPVLVLVIGVPMHQAIATSIVTVIAASSAVAGGNVERGTANMRLGMTLEIATALGAICGGLTAAFMPPALLEGLFAACLLPTAIVMLRQRPGEGETEDAAPVNAVAPDAARQPLAADGRLAGAYFDPATGGWVTYRVRRLLPALGVSFVAGNVSGLLGIGGGVFKVPALHLLCGMPIKAAAATSNFMIGVTAAASAFLYFGRGSVQPALTAAVVLGVLIGAPIGSWFGHFVHGRFLTRLFALLLVATAVQMLVRVWTSGVPIP